MAESKPKRGPCVGCGAASGARPVLAYVPTAAAGLSRHFVCAACAARGILVVIPEPAQHVRAVLAPFAAFLRRLAKPYELNDDGRAVGLHQAADVLESGRAVPPDEPTISIGATAPAPKGVMVLDIAGANYARPARVKPAEGLRQERDSHRSTDASANGATAELGACELTLLAVLSRQPDPISRSELGIRAGYAVTSGGYSSALGRLRQRSLIGGSSSGLSVTPEGGRALHGATDVPSPPENLVSYWAERLGNAAGSILNIAAAAYPNELSRVELAERAGYRVTSGGYSSALGRLRSLHLLKGCRASDALMRMAQR